MNRGVFMNNIGIIAGVALIGFLLGITLMLLAHLFWHRKTKTKIRKLTDYLEKINTGKQGLLLEASEDELSKLQDEIYKTITSLYQTRDAAVAAKKHYADNISNIAHQLKTPITALSLSVQMMKEEVGAEAVNHSRKEKSEAEPLIQMEKQLQRLTYLEEALLLLARIDAGTLPLKKEQTDVFTILTLAADNLQELLKEREISVQIPENGAVMITADLEWTMEAVMNLLKNCMEHSPEGAVIHCSYEENPLYVQVRILDEGPGFAEADLPHLFERFYRGKDAGDKGIGIGLSLAKEILELQDGILDAFNPPEGGACFELRFYCH